MIRVVRGDITRLRVDAIVNAANNALTDGGGVNGAIHRAAGHELDEACRRIEGGCPTGEARITPGFNLPARYVIHAVGPVWRGGDHGEARLLAQTYRAAFKVALEHDIKTIAFPAISTGIFGYPKEAAARIAVEVMLEFEDRFTEIIACVFNKEDEKHYLALLSA